MNTYKNYVEREKDTITIDECEVLMGEIKTNSNQKDSNFKELWNTVMIKAIDYSMIRAGWFTKFTQQERIETDNNRTIKHDSFITNLNMLSRYLVNEGYDISWRKQLGDERKRIGDFACYLAFLEAINAR